MSTCSARRAAVVTLVGLLGAVGGAGEPRAQPRSPPAQPGGGMAAPPIDASAPRVRLSIDGNLVLVDEVYLAVVELPHGARADAATAGLAARQVLSFLRRAGYALASVEARAEAGVIRIRVDEGRLARIVVRGRNTVATLAVQLQLDLPFDVFNRPQLERILERYAGDGRRVRFSLARVDRVEHTGLQVDPLALLPGGAPLPNESSYELRIEFDGRGRGAFTLKAGADPDSLRVGGGYAGPLGLLDGDRWELESQVGANYFEDLARQTDELHFSRVFGDVRWIAPGFLRDVVKPTVRLREDLLRRQRQDLLVETYWWNRIEGAAGFAIEPGAGLRLRAEVGVQRRDLFAVSQLEGGEEIEPVSRSSETRIFGAVTGRLVFDPGNLRIDRYHKVDLDLRQFTEFDGQPFWQLEAEYENVFEFGYNDLWLHAAGGWLGGSYGVADPIPMTGRYLRGVFGHNLYMDQAASAGVEFRLSLKRDDYKVGFYSEVAGYREARGGNPEGNHGVANSFGPSFHALVMDALQLDIYYAFGFMRDGPFEHGVSFRIEKAF